MRNAAAGFLDFGGDGKNDFLFVRTADDLNADRQTFGRMADGNDGGGIPEKIEPLGVTDGVEIGDFAAFDDPRTLAMAKSGNSANGTEQDGEFFHLREETSAQGVAIEQSGEESIESERRLGGNEGKKFEKDRAEFLFAAGDERAEEQISGAAEKRPPDLACLLEPNGKKGFDGETAGFERFCGGANGRAGFRSDRNSAVIFEKADTQILQFGFGGPANGNRSGVGVAGIRTGENLEKKLEIGDSARHRTNDAERGERTGGGREMTGGGNAARSGF